jgi:hypothetical protein
VPICESEINRIANVVSAVPEVLKVLKEPMLSQACINRPSIEPPPDVNDAFWGKDRVRVRVRVTAVGLGVGAGIGAGAWAGVGLG